MTEGAGDRARALLVRRLPGTQAYRPVWEAMRDFTETRGPETPDELWLLEHSPVFTLGQAARPAHLLDPGDIPVIKVDRGGQVTYHGPGQLIVYCMLDLRRTALGVKSLVERLEQAVIDLLATRDLVAGRRAGAPGVYVGDAKIAALGLRVRRGCTFHGVALNVAMDLAPFRRIDPCGYRGLAVTQMADLLGDVRMPQVEEGFLDALAAALGREAIRAAA